MHVLFIPKWYPGRNDPQLGDFLRKQALAVARTERVSVLHVHGLKSADAVTTEELDRSEGAWELHCYFAASTFPWGGVRQPINAWRYVRAARRGWRRLREEQGMPDVVHAHILLRPALFAWLLRLRYGIPFVISEQSSAFLNGTFERWSWWRRRMSRWLLRSCDGFTAVSPYLGDRMKALGLVDQYDVVPNVVPGTERPLPPRGGSGSFLMVADLVDHIKNVSGVIRAVAAVKDRHPEVHLTIIGDGPDRGLLEQLARELNVLERVTFLGRLPNREVLDHMGRTGAVIINSHVETFSVVTGEALAQGKPVIATRCGGPIAFITPNNGLLIPLNDTNALIAAMDHLIAHWADHDPATIRATVHDRFGSDAVGRCFVSLYHRIRHGH
jgi:alpha-maltose-1-phosphate synthase